jgi:hypothetical protein
LAERAKNDKGTGLRCIVVETISNRPPKDYTKVYLNISIGFAIAFAIVFSKHVPALVGLWNILGPFLTSSWWLIALSAGIFYAGLVIDERNRSTRGLLRVIKVDEKGIVMGRPGMSPRDPAFFIPWKMLTAVESGVDESGEQPYEYVMLRMGAYLAYKLRRDIGFNWIDEQTVVTKARQNAPNAKFAIERRLSDPVRQDTRYTNLWLQYLAPSGTRERRGHLQPGDIINRGRFEIIRVLGAGGQGIAYLAKTLDGPDVGDTTSDGLNAGDEVAIKEYILPVHANDGLSVRMKDSLDNEAKILSAISHPNIVALHDCFVEDHRGYMVLEYIDGESLRAHIKSAGPAKELLVAWWAAEICSILKYLKALSPPIVHRDLTPDNIIWKGDRHIKLFDFTVAHQFEAMRLATVVGKQSYMAPEQVKGYPCPQSDIYSLGATMHFLLTGQDPEPLSVSSPRSVRPEVSEEIDLIVRRCTAFDLKKRYADPSEIEKDLAQLK